MEMVFNETLFVYIYRSKKILGISDFIYHVVIQIWFLTKIFRVINVGLERTYGGYHEMELNFGLILIVESVERS